MAEDEACDDGLREWFGQVGCKALRALQCAKSIHLRDIPDFFSAGLIAEKRERLARGSDC